MSVLPDLRGPAGRRPRSAEIEYEPRQEQHVRSAEHAANVCIALVEAEARFDVRPEPDGWWRIRAKFPAPDQTADVWYAKNLLNTIVQQARPR